MGRKRGSLKSAIVDVWGRELGEIPTKSFSNRFAASQDLVLRLDVYKKLERHRGCVNTVSFSGDGDLLVSGSDDRRIIVWDWQSGGVKLCFHSGHLNNIFQARIMPYTEDRSIVTCAADGQVRHAQIVENGQPETKLLGRHRGRAHKLGIEPASPHIFYTCGEDGLVQHFDLRTSVGTPLFTCQSLPHRGPTRFVRLNTITIDPRSPHLFAVGGSDEYARLYDIRKYRSNGSTDYGIPVDNFCPSHLIGEEVVSITGLAFSDQSELLVSYSEEFIYLFTKGMGLGPDLTQGSVAMGSDKEEDKQTTSSYEMNDDDDDVIDETQDLLSQATTVSEIEKDEQTTESPFADFENEPQVFKGHINCETVKGVNFFGPKCEYIVSGSDCGRIFIWKKKSGELIRVMQADKHIVNCIESHPYSTVLASSGIENNIKIWTPKACDGVTLPTNVEKVLMPHRVRFFPYIDVVDDYEYDDDDTANNNNEEEEDNSGEEADSYVSSSDSDDDDNEGNDRFIDSSDHDDDECEESSDGFNYNNIQENNDGEGSNGGDDDVNGGDDDVYNK